MIGENCKLKINKHGEFLALCIKHDIIYFAKKHSWGMFAAMSCDELWIKSTTSQICRNVFAYTPLPANGTHHGAFHPPTKILGFSYGSSVGYCGGVIAGVLLFIHFRNGGVWEGSKNVRYSLESLSGGGLERGGDRIWMDGSQIQPAKSCSVGCGCSLGLQLSR